MHAQLPRACRICLALGLLGPLPTAAADLPQPSFYLPLDKSTTAALAGGSPYARHAAPPGAILALVESRRERFSDGVVGQGHDVGDAPLAFSCHGNFRPNEGSFACWLCPHFDGGETNLYCTFFGAAFGPGGANPFSL